MSATTEITAITARASLAENGNPVVRHGASELGTRNVNRGTVCSAAVPGGGLRTPNGSPGRILLLLLFLIVCGGATVASAQTQASATDNEGLLGIKPAATYHFGDIDSVDMESGNLILKIPLYSLPQLGNVPLSYSLILNTGGWNGYLTPVRQNYGLVPVLDGDLAQSTIDWDCGGDSNNSIGGCSDAYGLTDSTGAWHYTGATPTSSQPYDGSDLNGTTHPNGTTVGGSNTATSNGAISTYSLTDTNGNAITRTYTESADASTGEVTTTSTIADSLNRKPFEDISVPLELLSGAAATGFGDWQIDNGTVNSACPALAATAASSFEWTVPAPNQNADNVIFLFYFGTGDNNDTYLRNVVLPGIDGNPNCATYWEFDYEGDDLTQVRYPTGATIKYVYEDNGSVVPNANYPVHRAVISRTLTDSNSVDSGTWLYCFPILPCKLPNGSSYSIPFTDHPTTAMIDPSGNETDIEYDQQVGVGSYLETSRRVYAGMAGATSSQLLRTTITSYISPYTASSAVYPVLAPAGVPDSGLYLRQSVTTTLNDVSPPVSSTTSYTYAKIPGRFWGTYPIYYSKPTSVTTTDYTASGTGPVLRIDGATYEWENNGASVSANMLDRVAETTVKDGSSNLMADTTFSYDESPSPPTVTVNGTIIPRGNQTSTHRCSSIAGGNCGAWVNTSKIYNTNGMASQSTDANSNTTFFDYDLSGAFLQDIRYPMTGSVTHEEWFTFDHNSGEATAHTGQNCTSISCPEATTYQYDTLGRLKTVTYPNGGGNAAYNYYDTTPPYYTVDKQVTVSHSLHEEIDGDYLGQPVRKINDYVVTADTAYDSFGRVTSVSNPYYVNPQSGSNDFVLTDSSHGVTTGSTGSKYDALGRVYEVDRPDGNTVKTSYDLSLSGAPGPCTKVYDESGKWRESCTDALGRVTQVTEMAPSGSGANLVTDYRYDPVGNLVCVDQQGGVTGSGCDANAAAGGPWRVRRFTYDPLSRLTQAQNPESGTINYGYDNNGNVIAKTDADGHQTTYCYDQLNRLTGKGYGASASCSNLSTLAVQYGYDSPDSSVSNTGTLKPYRTTMDDASGHTAWNYDLLGRPTLVQRKVNVSGSSSPLSYGVAYSYNFDGTVAAIAYPSGRQVIYGYNNMGWNTWITKNDPISQQTLNYVSGVTYMPDGQVAEENLGAASGCYGGIMGEFSYNQRLQPAHLLYTTSGTPATSELTSNSCVSGAGEFMHRMYSFNNGSGGPNNGNVIGIANCLDSTRSQSFSYDNLNRVQSASAGFWGEQYTIDAWGNMTDIESGSTLSTSEPFYSEGLPLGTGTATSLNQLSGDEIWTGFAWQASAYTYDAAGNLTSADGQSYVYDQENRISSVNSGAAAYTYDGDGQRIVKNAASSTVYWYGAGGEILAESDLTGNINSEYVYFNGKRLARTDNPTNPATAQLRYYLSDHLGSAVMVMDETLTTVEEDTDYYPFGGIAYQNGPGDSNHYKFTGKERDSETGNDYFEARYYASNMGRFMSPDPAWFASPDRGNPQTWNLYAYVHNNPLNLVDPTGMFTPNDPDPNDPPPPTPFGGGGGGCNGCHNGSLEDASQYSGSMSIDSPAQDSPGLRQVSATAGWKGVAAAGRYRTQREAAIAAERAALALTVANRLATHIKNEYGGWILKDKATGQYTYTVPITENIGGHFSANAESIPAGFIGVADFHTHSHTTVEEGEGLSLGDELHADRYDRTGYEADTYSGNVYQYTPRVTEYKPSEFCCGVIGDFVSHVDVSAK
jgi:RHS repeat-associated protein